jgi:predicted AAA+ superfamily ATPase
MANDVGVSSTTMGQWLNLFEASFIVFRLSTYYQNLGKRLVRTPKLYFTEPGLVAWLLQIETAEQVRRDPLIGNLFENLVVGEAFKAAYNRGVTPRFNFYRDNKGLQIDLIHEVERIPRAIEIKSGTTLLSGQESKPENRSLQTQYLTRKFSTRSIFKLGWSVIYSQISS